MGLNLLKALQQELPKKKETLKRVENYYKRHFGETDKDISTKLNDILKSSTEEELKQLFEPSYPDICKAIKKDIPFMEYAPVKGKKPTEVLSTYVIYKFFELILDRWKVPDNKEKEILSLLMHLEEPKKEKSCHQISDLVEVLLSIMNGSYLFNMFAGSPELYAYVTDIMCGEQLKLKDIEGTFLSRKEIEYIIQCVCNLIDTNIDNDVYERPKFFLKFDIKYIKDDWQQFLILFFIGCLIKTFEKLISQKDKEIEKISADNKIETIYLEDTNSKKLVQQKQEALNNLQIQYDRLKKKYDEQQDILREYEECFKIIREQEEVEEKLLENNPGAKPFVPVGRGIVLYGGSPNYQKKFATDYPHVEIVPTNTNRIDRQKLINAKIILINWRYLSHAHFYTIINTIREHKKEYYYVW